MCSDRYYVAPWYALRNTTVINYYPQSVHCNVLVHSYYNIYQCVYLIRDDASLVMVFPF